MQNIFNIIENKKFNILTVTAHERTQSNLSDVNANFYMYKKSPHIKSWNSSFATLPENHYQLPEQYFPEGIQFDFVISHHRFGCFQELAPIAKRLKIPLICIEHTVPMNWPKEHFDQIKRMRGDINVYIGPNQAKEWGENNPYIIRHCVDTNIFYPQDERNNHILTVVNDYPGRGIILGFDQYLKVTNGLPKFPVGDSQGFSKPAKNVEELSNFYRSSRIFLNTSIRSPIPTSLLEAMSSGCACVSTNNCEIPYYLDHGVNALLANSDEEMRKYLEILLKDKDFATFLGENARKTILEKCSKDRYTSQWNELFNKLRKKQLRNEN